MKKIFLSIILLSSIILLAGCARGDIQDPTYLQVVVPNDATSTLGTETDPWANAYITNVNVSGSIIRDDALGNGGYWHEYNLGAVDLSPGASGATLIAPNASSLGGYQLNAINEYLLFNSHVEDDWDGTSNGVFQIYFEVNDDNSGGLVTDTVKLQLEVWHKQTGERVCTVYSLAGNTVVGQAQQHDLFMQNIAVGNLRARDVLSFRINLNTIQSQVTDVIVNYIEFKYQTHSPSPEKD